MRLRRNATSRPASATSSGINAMFATLVQNTSASASWRKNLRQDAEALVFWTKLANIALMPLLVALAGLLIALFRKRLV